MGRDLLKFFDVWPSGFEGLLHDLHQAGFAPKAQGLLTPDLLKSPEYFQNLQRPRSVLSNKHPSLSDFCFVGPKFKEADLSLWGLVLVDSTHPSLSGTAFGSARLLVVNQAEAAMDLILSKILRPDWTGHGVPHPSHVHCEAGVVIGPGCQIGENVVLESGVRLGARVRIGPRTRICTGTRLGDDTEIGSDCFVGANCSIGGPGFGFVKYPGSREQRRPRVHTGSVVLGHHVRIGSLVSIDRGVFEDTRVGDFSALDNLVQVGHNCVVGTHAILCSMVGLSGSTTLGNHVTIAGLSGTKDGVSVGDNVTIAAQSGVSHDLPDNSLVKGYPPRPLKEALEIQSLVTRLPEIYKRLKSLEKSYEGITQNSKVES